MVRASERRRGLLSVVHQQFRLVRVERERQVPEGFVEAVEGCPACSVLCWVVDSFEGCTGLLRLLRVACGR